MDIVTSEQSIRLKILANLAPQMNELSATLAGLLLSHQAHSANKTANEFLLLRMDTFITNPFGPL